MKRHATPQWLSVQCTRLSLDLVTRGLAARGLPPIAISDGDRRRPRILDCNPVARCAGIRPGLTVSAALGLLASLRVCARDRRAEQSALERLAAACYAYSSQVSLLADSHELLLEIGGSERLFGGTGELPSKLTQDVQRLGYQVRTGTGPTPEAARLAARHEYRIDPAAALAAQVRHLPLSSLALDASQQAALEKMGFRRIGEILRLPRKALGRRLGPAVVDYLDRLTGARADARTPWHPPDHFSSTLELPAEISDSQALLFPLRRLVAELCTVLRARDRGIQELRFRLRHRDGEERLRLGLQRPGRGEERIILLLRERLERLCLPAPVHRLRLEAPRLLPFDARQDGLFGDEPGAGLSSIAPLLERLQARLGAQAVTGLQGIPDHRPERSWGVREPDAAADCRAMPHRPVWLFAKPQACRIEDYRLLAGPERIETGWWDGHDCRRDYFVVRDPAGRTLWAFREYKPEPGWYLQGVFS